MLNELCSNQRSRVPDHFAGGMFSFPLYPVYIYHTLLQVILPLLSSGPSFKHTHTHTLIHTNISTKTELLCLGILGVLELNLTVGTPRLSLVRFA